MPLVLCDASATVKRFVIETGTSVMKALFDAVTPEELWTTMIGYSETFAILWRRHNGGVINRKTFVAATSSLETIFLRGANVPLEMDNVSVMKSLGMIQKHNLNSTDAVILTLYLQLLQKLGRKDAVLVTVDHRLLRAAQAEGLATLDPTNFDENDLPEFLANL